MPEAPQCLQSRPTRPNLWRCGRPDRFYHTVHSCEHRNSVEVMPKRLPNSTWSSMLVFAPAASNAFTAAIFPSRSEEHTSELQSLMRISYAVFSLKKKNNI